MENATVEIAGKEHVLAMRHQRTTACRAAFRFPAPAETVPFFIEMIPVAGHAVDGVGTKPIQSERRQRLGIAQAMPENEQQGFRFVRQDKLKRRAASRLAV
jgi:hypothetical protein